ncbi:NO-binding membrane sensor protein with MHYT domain [Bradyrhizobium sp. i1.7.7]
MPWRRTADKIMFEGHDPYLVALSVAVASLGGYTGFALAARIRNTPGVSNRVLLAGAAAFLAVGIWTMHFVGMLAAPLPPDTVYLVLPTIISFLICALVVGISLFFVSIGEPSLKRVASSAVLLGVGIASMHYVGIHGLAGHFIIVHDRTMVLLSVVVAIVTAYGGLRAFLAQQEGVRLIVSSIVFGVAVSGMHYTAMLGMHFEPLTGAAHHHAGGGLAASQQILSIIVAVLCFVIAAGFLLSLVPDQRRQTSTSVAAEPVASPVAVAAIELIAAPAAAPRPGGTPRRSRPAAPRAGSPIAGRERRRHALHRDSQCPQRPGRCALHPCSRRHPRANVPLVDLGGRGAARSLAVPPGAPQPYRCHPPCRIGPQRGGWRRARARRSVAASGPGQPCQDSRGEGKVGASEPAARVESGRTGGAFFLTPLVGEGRFAWSGA